MNEEKFFNLKKSLNFIFIFIKTEREITKKLNI